MKDIREEALKYLAHRSRSALEVSLHLEGKEFQTDEIKETLQFLTEFRYVDDEEYARQYLEYAFGKGKSLNRAKQELKQKGILAEIAQQVYEESVMDACADEEERALAQAEKITGNMDLDEKLMGKVARRLAALGYSSGTAYHVIGMLRKRTENPEVE